MTGVKWLFVRILRYYRNMGLRVALYAALALAVAFVSPIAAFWGSDLTSIELELDAVLPILNILASSMLAVSTFSLNIMVSAHRSAAGTTTPRVHRILLEDTTTQSVLATFIGAFVYSLTSIILLRSNFYTEDVAVIVMAITIVVVALVVVSLLRWIDHLKDLGSVDESMSLAKGRARDALMAFAEDPGFGARPLNENTVVPTDVDALIVPQTGYLQIIDVEVLNDLLPSTSALYVNIHPGDNLLKGQVLARVSGGVTDDTKRALADAFTFGEHRTHEQDTEFGLRVLAETALRALSPGINDPGTAIHAISDLKDVLWQYASEVRHPADDASSRVFVAFPTESELVEAAFAAIARDSAGTIEVATSLRAALLDLAACDNGRLATAALGMADLGIEYAEQANLLPREREILHKTKSTAAPSSTAESREPTS